MRVIDDMGLGTANVGGKTPLRIGRAFPMLRPFGADARKVKARLLDQTDRFAHFAPQPAARHAEQAFKQTGKHQRVRLASAKVERAGTLPPA
jgi:hypothetical protein